MKTGEIKGKGETERVEWTGREREQGRGTDGSEDGDERGADGGDRME